MLKPDVDEELAWVALLAEAQRGAMVVRNGIRVPLLGLLDCVRGGGEGRGNGVRYQR